MFKIFFSFRIRIAFCHKNSLLQSHKISPTATKDITHSGTGRFTWLTMRPMILYESGDPTGEVSLKELFDGQNEIALAQARNYYDAVVRSDINRADNENTVAFYPNALRKFFVTEDMPAWNPK